MFNFFKKKPNVSEIITAIHDDFDSASERLLNEAKNTITSTTTDKGDRLKAIGFINAKPVKETEEIRAAKREAQWLAERVTYFSQWYPHNKFITEEAVKSICNKYGLACADTAYYKGDVPEKNLKEIESFSLRKEDMDSYSDFDRYRDDIFRRRMMQASRIAGHTPFTYIEPSAHQIEEMKKSVTYTKIPFRICAPESDFDTSLLVKKGHKLELNIPDPIVLQPVNGGYLIVTKWGLEASDEDVVNSKDN